MADKPNVETSIRAHGRAFRLRQRFGGQVTRKNMRFYETKPILNMAVNRKRL